jgi:hypothetical protein
MNCWKVYAQFENRWFIVSTGSLYWSDAKKLERDLRESYGLPLCIAI